MAPKTQRLEQQLASTRKLLRAETGKANQCRHVARDCQDVCVSLRQWL